MRITLAALTILGWLAVQPALAQVHGGSGLYPDAAFSAFPSNPTGTTNTTGLMMGLGKDQAGSGAHPCTITPLRGTRLAATVSGDLVNSLSTDGALATLRAGTGTAPSNGDAAIGTALTQFLGVKTVFSNNAYVSVTLTGILTGATVGAPYWIDVQLASVTGGGAASLVNVSCAAQAF